jgi:hypothetical protein
VIKLEREAPLPLGMQGRWIEADDPSSELIVSGGEITCYGEIVQYDYKEVDDQSGALAITLRVNDAANEDAFERANITGLVITPEGEFHVWNVKFAAQFVRPSP